MKKVISMLLTLTLLLSFAATLAVQTGAEEAAETAKAPAFYGIQLTDAVDNKQNIRFISVLTSLEGDAVGYKITADYLKEGKNWTKTVDYEKETTEVYASLLADTAYGSNTAVTAEALATEMQLGEGKGLLALVLTDVPTNLGEITFTVETYVKNGDTTVTSDESYFIVENGVKSSKKVLFREDCNDSPTIKGLGGLVSLSNVDETDTQNGGKALKAVNYQLFEIVPDAALKNVDHYTFEVDAFGASASSYVTFYLNYSMAKDDLASQTSGNPYNLKDGKTTAMQVQIRNNGTDWASGLTFFSTKHRTDGFSPAIDRHGAAQTNASKALSCTDQHHYAIEVDNSGDTATVQIYVDGVSYLTATGAPKGAFNSIYLMGAGAADSAVTFDNLKVTEGAYLTQKAS